VDYSRGADWKFSADRTAGRFGLNGAPIGVNLGLWGDVAELKKGHEYELRYQIRVHTKAGELGPVLGNADHPAGRAFTLVKATYTGQKWFGLERDFDLVRGDLSGMTGLPDTKDYKNVFLRIEPRLYDVTEKKYTGPERPDALIVVASVGPRRDVWGVQSLHWWIVDNARYDTKKVLDALASLDAYDHHGNDVANAVGAVLEIAEVAKATKVKLIRAVPPAAMDPKLSWTFNRKLDEYAAGTDADLKSVAVEKLEQKRLYDTVQRMKREAEERTRELEETRKKAEAELRKKLEQP
jgi:hypothetical protein